jgi:hypothetical protein
VWPRSYFGSVLPEFAPTRAIVDSSPRAERVEESGAELGVRVNGAELRRQLDRRCLSAADLAALSHLAPATISHALNDRAISPSSLRAIAGALETAPVFAEQLLA